MTSSEPVDRIDLDGPRWQALARVARLASEDLALRPMLQRLTDELSRSFGAELVALVRVDTVRGRFECEAVTSRLETEIRVGYSRELGSGVVGHVAESGQAVVLDDVSTFPGYVDTLTGARAEICVPVKHLGKVVAVLNAESPRPAAFRGELPLWEAIAGQISGAVANARLYDSMRRRSAAFEVLSDVSRLALSGADVDSQIREISSYLQARFDLALVAIVIADDAGREWVHRAIVTRPPAVPIDRPRWPIEDGIVGRALRSGEPQLILDVRADPDYLAVRDGVVAELAVPLGFRERIFGAINFESESAQTFSDDLVALFTALADQVAGAIELAVLNRRLEDSQVELARANRRLERLAQIDALTGVANRRRFDAQLGDEWARAVRYREPLSVAVVDIDQFKEFNDTYGHPRGDEALKRVAEVLSEGAARAGDLVARYGGEEFMILLPRLEADSAALLVNQLRRRIEDLALDHSGSDCSSHLTVSAGVATVVPASGMESDDLIARADAALYRAKNGGRNRVEAG